MNLWENHIAYTKLIVYSKSLFILIGEKHIFQLTENEKVIYLLFQLARGI